MQMKRYLAKGRTSHLPYQLQRVSDVHRLHLYRTSNMVDDGILYQF